ncbi:MAG TPA: response regulator, partial [Xanthobacteraceae bacterium]
MDNADDRRLRVLLVEDEFLICMMMADALTDHGFEVRSAANAQDALAHLTRGAPCDVLLTDLNLG